MKSLIHILIIITISLKALGIGQAAEIFFYQDSILSNKIHLEVKILSPIYHTGYEQDSLFIDWGDGSQSVIYLSDSVLVPGLNYPLYDATYSGIHTYDSVYLNDFVSIGYGDGPRLTGIMNIPGSENTNFYIRTLINFNILKRNKSYISPHFNASLYANGSIYHALTYNPQLLSSNSLSTKISLINPLGELNGNVPYQLPNRAFPSADTILTCDSISGLFYWSYPSFTGFYDVTYEVTQFQNDTLVSAIMQDMLLAIDGGSSGIIENNINHSLHCYPSPSSGTFTIDISSYDAEEKQVHIYDQLGQIVYHTMTIQDRLEVDIRLAAGIYTVEVMQGARRDYTRFVKE